jgi:hypothetical protein
MSFLGGGSNRESDAAAKAQREQIANQERTLAKQEAALAAERTEMAERAMATSRARRGGGLRSLLSSERMDSETGISTRSTLGA